MKKWLVYMIIGFAAGLLAVAALNAAVDPFGVFGDRLLNWYGYDITNNPKLAKFAYLDKNHGNYDGYVLGTSKASSINPLLLNKYYDGASFYNLMLYGANYAHMENACYYVVNKYGAKHIVLSLGITELNTYGYETDDVKEELHAEVYGGDLFGFYMKYLFLNPKYSADKLAGLIVNAAQPKPTKADVFLPELGVYNKARRDTENIVNIYDYYNEIGAGSFANAPWHSGTADVQTCLAAVRRMKEFCGERGVTFEIISTPSYDLEIQQYDPAVLTEYWRGLAEITPFWNFSGYSALSYDPRFSYDVMHFRNSAGEMVLGKVFNDADVYVPENFGLFFTPENAEEYAAKLLTPTENYPVASQAEKTRVPILMYHHIVEGDPEDNWVTISADLFRKHMEAIKAAGYTTLFYGDLRAYADGEAPLPPKPLLITFDDGYASNYDIAFPILKELGLKATISVIGVFAGLDRHPETGEPMVPHFSWEQAREMQNSGLIDIQSHSYDLHYEDKNGRTGALRANGETTAAYAEALRQDAAAMKTAMERGAGKTPDVFTYPYGFADALSDFILDKQGLTITALTGDKINTVIKGDPRTLKGLYRINVNFRWSAGDLIWKLEHGGL